MGVAEDQPRRCHALEQLVLVLGRLGEERAHVGDRASRGRACRGARDRGREVGERRRVVGRRAPSRQAAIAPCTTGLSGASSGCAVQRSPLPRIHSASSSLQARDASRAASRRTARSRRRAAKALDARGARVGQHRLERRRGCRGRRRAAQRHAHSIGCMSIGARVGPAPTTDPLVVAGPTLTLRYARSRRRAARCSSSAATRR